MNRTETNAADAAAIFYAEFLLPLRMANRRARLDYLDRQSGEQSGWAAIASRNGGHAHVKGGQTDIAALLDELGTHWRKQGEERLLQLLPHLLDLARSMTERNAPSAPITEALPDFIYPLY